MAMSIGANTVDIMNGRPVGAVLRVETLPRMRGEKYERYRKVGTFADARRIRTMKADLASAAAADTLDATYKALISTRVTITDGHGVAWPECMIIDVTTRVGTHHTGAAQKWRLDAVWTIHQGDPSP